MKKRLFTVIGIMSAAAVMYLFTQSTIKNIPDADDISTVSIEINGNSAETDNKELIQGLLDELSRSRRTFRSSSGEPAVDPFWKIELTCTDGSEDTYYFYEISGTNYIERPYEDIYRVDSITNDYVFSLFRSL